MAHITKERVKMLNEMVEDAYIQKGRKLERQRILKIINKVGDCCTPEDYEVDCSICQLKKELKQRIKENEK